MGFVVYLQRGDIYFESRIDTIKIEQTTGYYVLEEEVFRGQDGFVDWSNLGIPSSERQMRLNQYEFKPSQQEFVFHDVLLRQPNKIDGSVAGDLTIQIVPGRGEREYNPKFISYNANTRIKGLGSNHLIFQGGINYQGVNFSLERLMTNPPHSSATMREKRNSWRSARGLFSTMKTQP